MVLERADQRALQWLVQVLSQKVHHQWEPVPEHQIIHLHLLQMHSVRVLRMQKLALVGQMPTELEHYQTDY